jgi:hypothetical protein
MTCNGTPGRRCGKPAANRLTYDRALLYVIYVGMNTVVCYLNGSVHDWHHGMLCTENAFKLFLYKEEGFDGNYSEMMSISALMIDHQQLSRSDQRSHASSKRSEVLLCSQCSSLRFRFKRKSSGTGP